MLIEFLEALLKAALPVGLVTFGMVFWALLNGYLTENADQDALEKELNQMSKGGDSDQLPGDFLHRKWVKFGGGFYGVVALITYAVVETGEVGEFLANFEGIRHFLNTISINMVIDFFIDSLMNFITAIAWPAYWLSDIDRQHAWVWFIAAYLGYLAGARAARHFYFDPNADHD